MACGRSAARPLYDVNGFSIVECACGLARTVLPPGFDPASIYTEDYFQGGHRDGYADYLASGDELRYEFRRILDGLGHRVAGGKLIELGCAYGFFLEEAAKTFSVCGVEISDHARTVCAERGLEVVADATPEFLASHGPFDAAVMLDVLEHMPDPDQALDRLHASMRPGAQLVVTTGDFGSAVARAMGKRWRLMTPPQHLWFFSPATVTMLLERHGFRVHTVEHPWKLVPLALIAYQASRYVGGQDVVRRLMPRGRLPVNLFDAMRVIAERLPDDGDARQDARYELACRHARGRVLDVACGLGDGARMLAERGRAIDEVVAIDAAEDVIRRATARSAPTTVRFACADPSAYHDRAGFDTVVVLGPPPSGADLELTVVRAIAALRRPGVLITHGSLRTTLERYGLRPIDQAGSGDGVTIACQRVS